MMTTDDFVSLTREQQRDTIAAMTDDERRTLKIACHASGHSFAHDRAARDHQVLTSTSPVLKAERESLLSEYRKAREHLTSRQHRIANGEKIDE